MSSSAGRITGKSQLCGIYLVATGLKETGERPGVGPPASLDDLYVASDVAFLRGVFVEHHANSANLDDHLSRLLPGFSDGGGLRSQIEFVADRLRTACDM